MSAPLPKWLAKYERHSNIFNEMTAKHSASFLVICFTSEKTLQFYVVSHFCSSIIHLLQSYPASFSRCGFSFCLRRTNWDTGQLCTFNSAFGYGGYGLWTSSWSLYCRWTVLSRFFHLLHRSSWKDNYAMSSCLRIPYIQWADSMRKPLILKINHDQS